MNTQNVYIGMGRAAKHNAVSVSIRMEDAEKFLRKTDKGTWLNFIVAPVFKPKEDGPSHKVFIITGRRTDNSAPSVASEPAPKAAAPGGNDGGEKPKKKAAPKTAKAKKE